MQIKKNILVLIIGALSYNTSAQYNKTDPNFKECFIGSSLFMLGNLDSENKPDFLQLNLGYRITNKDVVSIEVKTWKYTQPLGIPFGKEFTNPLNKFPGAIREKGFAIAYQRFLYKGFYTAIHVMSAWQSFENPKGVETDKGFQIFNTYRLGYHFKIPKTRFFIEPSIAITHRPYHTQMPYEFRVLDNQHSKLFFGEPGLHFGYNF
ncbi:hypothetical protein N9901_00215 [Flavobacteriaceae bacterium]|nr:hypothetical protein [Flavobacteriaceae bacterium]